jgi:hypothetical protein
MTLAPRHAAGSLALPFALLAVGALPGTARAQTTGQGAVPPAGLFGAPGTAFEQDGNVRAGTLAGGHVDWSAADGGPGVIDVTTFVDDPLFHDSPFLLGHAKLLTSSGYDAVLCRDANAGSGANPVTGVGQDATVFDGGSTNLDPIGAGEQPWHWTSSSGMPAAEDLTNCAVATVLDAARHRWLLFSVEVRSVSAEAFIDLELNQLGIVPAGGQLVGLGPSGGRTEGDVLVSVTGLVFPPALTLRRWDQAGGAWLEQPVSASTAYVRTQADAPAPGGFWGHFTQSGADSATIDTLQLVEGALDLTALGLEPAACSAGGTVLFKTRGALDVSSALRDFALVPFDVVPSPWHGLGHALAGAHGPPTLEAQGTLVAGCAVAFSVDGALENTTASLVLGLDALDLPFKGGVLVPQLDVVVQGLATGPLGSFELSGAWPAGLPAGTVVYAQSWIVDPSGPQGYAASNAVAGTVP